MSASGLKQTAIAIGMAAAACAAPETSVADHQPSIVVSTSRGVPPLIDGFDATGAIIEGDWGLYRPGAGTVTVYTNPILIFAVPPPPGYFPSSGRLPGYGRHEVEPRGRRPAPAPSYRRSWSTDAPTRTITAYPPPDPPPVIEALPSERFRRRGPRRHRRPFK